MPSDLPLLGAADTAAVQALLNNPTEERLALVDQFVSKVRAEWQKQCGHLLWLRRRGVLSAPEARRLWRKLQLCPGAPRR